MDWAHRSAEAHGEATMNVNRSPEIPVRAFIGQGCPIYKGDDFNKTMTNPKLTTKTNGATR